MNKETIFTVSKAVILILILLAVVFALRAPAADLNILPADIKGDYVDSTGLPYFSEMDSYYNLRLTQDYIDHGYAGDTIVNGTEVDMHRMAPDGVNVSYELGISYVTAFLHELANRFGDYSVKEVAFWAGAIVASFAVVPAFIFARRLTNDYGAFAAALLIGLAPNYFAHTFPGFFDTDMFYYIFSLFFIFFFVESLRSDNLVLKIIFALLSVISIGIFSQQWGGYIFYIGLMAIFVIAYLIACYIFNVGDSNRNEYSSKLMWFIHQKDFLSIILLVAVTLVGVILFAGLDVVTNLSSTLLSMFSLQSASSIEGGFPNVMISVAEMQAPTLLGAGMGSAFLANSNGVINGIGGMLILFAGLTVLFIMVSRVWKLRSVNSPKKESKSNKANRVSPSAKLDNQRKFKLSLSDFNKFGNTGDLYKTKRLSVLYTTLFVVWVVVTMAAVSMGSRFTTTIVLPFAFLTGIFIGYMMDYVKNNLNNDKLLVAIIIIAGLLAAFPLTQINLIYGLLLLGVIVDLGQYKEYAPNYFKILGENHDYDKAASTDDGKYYGFATINSGDKLLTVTGPAIRKDWLDELGMNYPETIDEWETMLRAFKEKKNAEIPFSFDYGSISTVFGMFEARFDPMVKDGKVVYGPAQPEFKRALETMNNWFNEGLLDKNIVSVDKSLLESQILSGKTGATFTPGGTGLGSLQSAGSALDSKFSLNAAPYPTYEKGAVNSAVKVLSPIEGYALAITTSCQHPEIAARVLDYLYSEEGNELANFGIEGETFNYVDGKPVYTELLTKNPDGLTMAQALGKYVRVGTGNGFVVREEYIEQYYGLPQQQSIFDFWAKNVKNALAETVPAIKVTADESAEYSDIMNEVNKYRNQMIVKFITGIEPIENFDKYVDTLNKYGLEKAMDIKTKALERYNGR